jgi:hypothetical protein
MITAKECDRLALAGLNRCGIYGDSAACFLKLWDEPTNHLGALLECQNRRLALWTDDLTDFMIDRFGRTHFPDYGGDFGGQPLHPDGIGWSREIIEALLEWAVANARGTPTLYAEEYEPGLLLTDVMIESLRAAGELKRQAYMLALMRESCIKYARHPTSKRERKARKFDMSLHLMAFAGDIRFIEILENSCHVGPKWKRINGVRYNIEDGTCIVQGSLARKYMEDDEEGEEE